MGLYKQKNYFLISTTPKNKLSISQRLGRQLSVTVVAMGVAVLIIFSIIFGSSPQKWISVIRLFYNGKQ